MSKNVHWVNSRKLKASLLVIFRLAAKSMCKMWV